MCSILPYSMPFRASISLTTLFRESPGLNKLWLTLIKLCGLHIGPAVTQIITTWMEIESFCIILTKTKYMNYLVADFGCPTTTVFSLHWSLCTGCVMVMVFSICNDKLYYGDITNKLPENFTGSLEALNKELQPKFCSSAAICPLYVQRMLNSWFRTTKSPVKYFRNLSVTSPIGDLYMVY